MLRSTAWRYRTLLRYAIPAAPTLSLVALVTLASSALAMLEPWPMKILVDHVLTENAAGGNVANVIRYLPDAGSRSGLLAWVAGAGLMIFALGSVVEIILTDAWVRAGQRITFGLAGDVFAKLQRRSQASLRNTSIGDAMTRVMADSWSVNTLVDVLLFKPVFALITGAGIIAIMVRMDARLTLISLLVVPVMVAASFLSGRSIRTASEARRDIEVRINSHVQVSLTGHSVVQGFAQEEVERRRFGELAIASIIAEQRAARAGQLNSLASGLITTSGIAAILWIGSRDVISGRLTIGGLLLFVAYLRTLEGKLRTLAATYPALQSVDASVNRVIETLMHNDVTERPHARRIKRSSGRVRFESVSFGYEPGRLVLQNISLHADPGETIAIVGATGAGKSTLVSLIPRFADPATGRVMLDDTDIRELQIEDLRRQIAWVPQESFLFPLSIADNISYGRPDAKPAEIEAAAVAADAHEFIQRLPNGYATLLGERGMTLSGGERQRLAIARALLVDAPILILDEPTSSLDAETDDRLQGALGRVCEGRTVFVIAHRLHTIQRASRVVVLDHGQVVVGAETRS